MKQSDGLLPQMEAPEKMTFSEALLASLKQQRSSLLGNGQKPLCDVILKCGNIATRSHSSVLASVSKYFERILTERHSNTQVCTLYKKQIESILCNFSLHWLEAHNDARRACPLISHWAQST